jgi:signal transduction histidine kinase
VESFSHSTFDDERSAFVEGIQSSSRTLLKIIDKIIESSKVECEKLSTKKELVLDDSLLNDLKIKFQNDINNFEETKARLDFELNGKKKPEILIDRNKTYDILQNIIENAIKFTRSGKIKVGYKLVNNNAIQFYIEDTGIGIPNDKLNKIFEKFKQVEENHRKKHSGLGVGLSISKKLTEHLGGEIKVKSELGKGSIFYVELPCEVIERKSFNINHQHIKNKYRTDNQIINISKIYPTREKIAPEFSHTPRVNNSRA